MHRRFTSVLPLALSLLVPATAAGAPPNAADPPLFPPEIADPGPEFLPLHLAGSLWTRYEIRAGYAEHGLSHPRLHREGDYWVSRARVSLSTNPVDVGGESTVWGKFVPQAAYTFGENTGTAPTVSDHPALALYEGYVGAGSPRYELQVGRFMLNYGDALVIGDLGWNEAARSFNGGRLRLTPGSEPFYVDFIGTLISDGRATSQAAFEGDTYFYGAYAGLGPLLASDIELDAYLLVQTVVGSDVVLVDPADATVTAAGDQESATDVTLGARVKGKASIVDYRAEAGVQFGKSPVTPTLALPSPNPRTKVGYQIDAEVGVTPIREFGVSLEGLLASGDDPATADKNEGYNELYPTSHKFLGFSDVMGPRTNVASAVLHLRGKPIEPLGVSLDVHYFSRLEPGADGRNGAAGVELDTNVAYAIGKGSSVRGMYAVFLPAEDYWELKATSPGVAGDPIHFFELQFGYDFK